jgi:type II secretory ATPase GspE/PulE/Tfp pilus assembly ATPase PilB-like protein
MPPKTAFFHGEGCVFCAQTGYQGRIGVYEVLKVTDEMKALIVANATHDQLKEMATEQGMVSLQDQALRLVERDVTTIAEILRTIYVL